MKISDITTLFLRCSLSAGFLSAVASRLDLWGKQSSGWANFLDYTAQINSFLPHRFILTAAVISTILETCLGIFLLLGFKTRYTAFAAGLLTLIFALTMSYSFGIKEPLDYSVFAFSAGAFHLATSSYYKLSIDQLLCQK